MLGMRYCRFQREGVEFAVRHGGRALIADDMGLGKTVQVGRPLPSSNTPSRLLLRLTCTVASPTEPPL
jgi:SNF2 family DNA or RNA helicase